MKTSPPSSIQLVGIWTGICIFGIVISYVLYHLTPSSITWTKLKRLHNLRDALEKLAPSFYNFLETPLKWSLMDLWMAEKINNTSLEEMLSEFIEWIHISDDSMQNEIKIVTRFMDIHPEYDTNSYTKSIAAFKDFVVDMALFSNPVDSIDTDDKHSMHWNELCESALNVNINQIDDKPVQIWKKDTILYWFLEIIRTQEKYKDNWKQDYEVWSSDITHFQNFFKYRLKDNRDYEQLDRIRGSFRDKTPDLKSRDLLREMQKYWLRIQSYFD